MWRRVPSALCLLVLLLFPGACADRARRNPLDPEAEAPQATATPLTAVAGDGHVRLKWDYTHFRDVAGLRLYRRDGEKEQVRELATADTALTDEAVTNGVTYEYRLSLMVSGEGERLLAGSQLATPGPEVLWLADGGSGLVWQISPDGRSTRFARGRFYRLEGLAVNRGDGSCWVSDGRSPALYRISREGEVSARPARLGQAGDLSLDPAGQLGWVADRASRRVHAFAPGPGSDSLGLAQVDASFEEPVSLAAVADACWIADRRAGRVLLYRRDGARLGEWQNLAAPEAVAASAAHGETAWVLADGGRQVIRLAAGGPAHHLEMPFAPVVALRADPASGECWVLGETEAAAVDPSGAVTLRVALPDGGIDLAADAWAGHLWIARPTELWKLAVPGIPRARLIGFSRVLAVELDPGR